MMSKTWLIAHCPFRVLQRKNAYWGPTSISISNGTVCLSIRTHLAVRWMIIAELQSKLWTLRKTPCKTKAIESFSQFKREVKTFPAVKTPHLAITFFPKTSQKPMWQHNTVFIWIKNVSFLAKTIISEVLNTKKALYRPTLNSKNCGPGHPLPQKFFPVGRLMNEH